MLMGEYTTNPPKIPRMCKSGVNPRDIGYQMYTYCTFEDAMTGDQLSQFRKDHDLTQAEFAEKVGISRRTLSAYEAGARSVPAYFGWICAAIYHKQQPYSPIERP